MKNLSQRRDRVRSLFGGSVGLALLAVVMIYGDGLNCLAGDCRTEPWLWVALLVPASVAVVTGLWLLLSRRP